MSEFRLSFPACMIAGKQHMTSHDMRLLRLHSFPDGIRTSDDVITIMTLNVSCEEKPPEWERYFVEQMTAHIVYHRAPKSYIDEGKAQWISRVFATDGIVANPIELECILHVIDHASRIPASLTCLVINQLMAAFRGIDCAYVKRYGAATDNPDAAIGFLQRALRHSLGQLATPLSPDERAALKEVSDLSSGCAKLKAWFEDFDAQLHRQDQARAQRPANTKRWIRVADDILLGRQARPQR